MAEKRYGRPSMTNLPYDLGKRIFEEMLSTPRPDREAMKKKADKMEAEMHTAQINDYISNNANCDWDDRIDLINMEKHHIGFKIASKAFYDPYFLEIEDQKLYDGEQRYRGFGNINGIATITVIYTKHSEDGKIRHRLLSARSLGPEEKEQYEQYIKSYF